MVETTHDVDYSDPTEVEKKVDIWITLIILIIITYSICLGWHSRGQEGIRRRIGRVYFQDEM